MLIRKERSFDLIEKPFLTFLLLLLLIPVILELLQFLQRGRYRVDLDPHGFRILLAPEHDAHESTLIVEYVEISSESAIAVSKAVVQLDLEY